MENQDDVLPFDEPDGPKEKYPAKGVKEENASQGETHKTPGVEAHGTRQSEAHKSPGVEAQRIRESEAVKAPAPSQESSTQSASQKRPVSKPSALTEEDLSDEFADTDFADDQADTEGCESANQPVSGAPGEVVTVLYVNPDAKQTDDDEEEEPLAEIVLGPLPEEISDPRKKKERQTRAKTLNSSALIFIFGLMVFQPAN